MNGFQKFLYVVNGHEKTDFSLQQLFWLRLIFDPFSDLMDQKKAGAKKVVMIKNQFFHAHQPRKEIFEIHSLWCCNFMTTFPELLMATTIPGVENPFVSQQLLNVSKHAIYH